MLVWFATGNIHKKQELAAILSAAIPARTGQNGIAVELKIPRDAGLDFNPEETGSTFFENAFIKAQELYRLLEKKGTWRPGNAIIADDSGICVDALEGRPGIYSARYSGPEMVIPEDLSQRREGTKNAEGIQICKIPSQTKTELSDADRNVLLLEELGDNPRRSSRFVCAMVLYYSPDRFFAAQETLEGELVKNMEAARGKGGFGYDPVLYIPALGRTVAELTEDEKNKWSHRGKAGRAIARILDETF